jgi:signal transduction histidine kinase
VRRNGTAVTVANGLVDADGRLVSADDRLLRLHLDAGGAPGGRLAIPQLATLARLARSLGILVSRTVPAADGLKTVELIVRAKPDGGNVHLAVGGWEEAPAPAEIADENARSHDFARLEADGAWETDAGLRVIRFSPGLDADLGDAGRSAIGQPLALVFALEAGPDGEWPLLPALARQTPFSGQAAMLGARRVTLSGEPRFGADGNFAGLHGRLVFSTGAVQATPAAVSRDPDFPSRLDAALRAPIGRIVDQADTIAAQGDGPLRREYVGYAGDIAAAGRHLLGLVDDLVDLQAIEGGAASIDFEIVDLADAARRAAGLLGVRASDKEVRIDAPDTDETLDARGDFRRVLQILVNLVGNAVRYSPPGSMVWIRIEDEGDLAAVIVADQGKGIAIEDQDRIFEKFERVDPSEPGGSGLGLFISRRLARLMGGDITVDSAPGMGARFVLTLPKS